jgi:hypothetical protein
MCGSRLRERGQRLETAPYVSQAPERKLEAGGKLITPQSARAANLKDGKLVAIAIEQGI